MARRRVICKDIYHRRSFLELPVTARDLYTYLVLNTDNDGIAEAYSVMNMIKTDVTSLELLEQRGFVKVLNNEYATYICSFQDFNTLDKRGKISQYRQLLVDVFPEVECKLIPEKNKKNDNSHGIPKELRGNSHPNPTEQNQTQPNRTEKNQKEPNITTTISGEVVVVEKIADYINKKGYTHINATDFFNYYSDRGWVCNNSMVRDWRALVDLWEQNPHTSSEKRDYDYAEIERDFLCN